MISLKEECQLHIYFFYSVIILRLSKPKTLVHVRNKNIFNESWEISLHWKSIPNKKLIEIVKIKHMFNPSLLKGHDRFT